MGPYIAGVLSGSASTVERDVKKQQIDDAGVAERYKVLLTKIEKQPWGMLDFVLKDPTGVLWRFGQNQK